MKIKFNGFELEGSANEIAMVSAELKGILTGGSHPGRHSGSLPEGPRKAFIEVPEGTGRLPEGYRKSWEGNPSATGRLPEGFLPHPSGSLPLTIAPALTTYPISQEPDYYAGEMVQRPIRKWRWGAIGGCLLSLLVLAKVMPKDKTPVAKTPTPPVMTPAITPAITQAEPQGSYLDELLPIYKGKK